MNRTKEEIECLQNLVQFYYSHKLEYEVVDCECGNYFEVELYPEEEIPFQIIDAERLIQLYKEENKK